MADFFNRIAQYAVIHPNKKAIIDAHGDQYTYLEFIKRIHEILKSLMPLLINEKTRVMLCIESSIELPVIVLALNSKNATIIPIPTTLKPAQIKKFITVADPNLIIVDKNTFNLFIDINLPQFNITTDKWIKEIKLIDKTISGFLVTLTSGSTGEPKPIIFTEKNKIDRAEQAVQLFKLSSEDVILCASPFHHSLGQRLTLLPLYLGATLVILKRFNVESWMKLVEDYEVTFTIPVSSHINTLSELMLKDAHRLRSLKAIVSSSAMMLPSVKELLAENLNFDFYEMYGASEIGTATVINLSKRKDKILSVGKPCENVAVKIFNKSMEECEVNTIGQISVKSNLVSPGYFGMNETTLKSFYKEYFLTGDLGYLDKDKFLYFVDREKDVIISGGVNIYPSDIESTIKKIKSVKDVCVVGVNDKYLGEVVVAVLVIENNKEDIVLTKIKNIVKKQLSSWQQPMKYIIKNALPLTNSGKYNKKIIRDELNTMNLDLTSKLRALQNGYGNSNKS